MCGECCEIGGGRKGYGHHGWRKFRTKEKVKNELESYKEELKKELKAVEEKLEELK